MCRDLLFDNQPRSGQAMGNVEVYDIMGWVWANQKAFEKAREDMQL